MRRTLTPRDVVLRSDITQFLYSGRHAVDWAETPFAATFFMAPRDSMRVRSLSGKVITMHAFMNHLLESMCHTSIFTTLPVSASSHRVVEISPEVDMAIMAYQRARRLRRRVYKNLQGQGNLRRYLKRCIQGLRDHCPRTGSYLSTDLRRALQGKNREWWGVDDEVEATLLNIGPIAQEGFSSWMLPIDKSIHNNLYRMGTVYQSLSRSGKN